MSTAITSNTSSLPAGRIFAELKHPERATVTHFFAPAWRNPAVEVIAWPHAAPELVAWLRCLPLRNASIRLGSLWRTELAGFDVAYAFLSPVPMPALWAKARREMPPGTRFISHSFEVVEAVQTT